MISESPPGWCASISSNGGAESSPTRWLSSRARACASAASSAQATISNGGSLTRSEISQKYCRPPCLTRAKRARASGCWAIAATVAAATRLSSSRPATRTSHCTLQGSRALSRSRMNWSARLGGGGLIVRGGCGCRRSYRGTRCRQGRGGFRRSCCWRLALDRETRQVRAAGEDDLAVAGPVESCDAQDVRVTDRQPGRRRDPTHERDAFRRFDPRSPQRGLARREAPAAQVSPRASVLERVAHAPDARGIAGRAAEAGERSDSHASA